MLSCMTTRTNSPLAATVLVAALAAAAACSDQGAVKGQAAKPAATTAVQVPAAVPAPVSSHDAAASMPQTAPPTALPPVPEGAGTGATGLQWTAPSAWISETPSSPMRRAQYRIPGKSGDGECVVFYFGPGQGGDPMSNASRWADQFTMADGSPAQSAMKTSEIEVGGLQ